MANKVDHPKLSDLKGKLLDLVDSVKSGVGKAVDAVVDATASAANDAYFAANPLPKNIIISNSDINITTVPNDVPPMPPKSSLDGATRIEKAFEGKTFAPGKIGVAYDSRAKMGGSQVLAFSINGHVVVTTINGDFTKGPFAARLREMSHNPSGHQIFEMDQSELGPIVMEWQDAMMAPIMPRSFEEVGQPQGRDYALSAHFPEHDLNLSVQAGLDIASKSEAGMKAMQYKELGDLIIQIGGAFTAGKDSTSTYTQMQALQRLPLPMRSQVVQQTWGGAMGAIAHYSGSRSGIAGLKGVRERMPLGFEAPAEPMPSKPVRWAGIFGGLGAMLRGLRRRPEGEEAPVTAHGKTPDTVNVFGRRDAEQHDVDWAAPRTQAIDVDMAVPQRAAAPVVVRPTLLPARQMSVTDKGARITVPDSGGPVTFDVARRAQSEASEGVMFLNHTTVSRQHGRVTFDPATRTVTVTDTSANGMKIQAQRSPLTNVKPGTAAELKLAPGITTFKVFAGDAEMEFAVGAAKQAPAPVRVSAAAQVQTPQPTIAQPAIYKAMETLATPRGLTIDHTSGHRGDLTVRFNHSVGNRLALTFPPDIPSGLANTIAERFLPAVGQNGSRVRVTVTLMNDAEFNMSCTLYGVRGDAMVRAQSGGLIRASLGRAGMNTTAAAGNRIADARGLILDMNRNDLDASHETPIEFNVALRLNDAGSVRGVRDQLSSVLLRMRTLIKDANAVVPRFGSTARPGAPTGPQPLGDHVQVLMDALEAPQR